MLIRTTLAAFAVLLSACCFTPQTGFTFVSGETPPAPTGLMVVDKVQSDFNACATIPLGRMNVVFQQIVRGDKQPSLVTVSPSATEGLMATLGCVQVAKNNRSKETMWEYVTPAIMKRLWPTEKVYAVYTDSSDGNAWNLVIYDDPR